MPAVKQDPLGHGYIMSLGVNEARGTFSVPYNALTIHEDGIEGDIYRGMWRELSAHDGDYIVTDGLTKGDLVLNMRQITIVDYQEVLDAGKMAKAIIHGGMLRENISVLFTPENIDQTFSKLPPMSRMVIGKQDPMVLTLTEENTPCRTISGPITIYNKGDRTLDENLREHLTGRRGQMAMVRTRKTKIIKLADPFIIYPPLT